jgi:hypothetical protein
VTQTEARPREMRKQQTRGGEIRDWVATHGPPCAPFDPSKLTFECILVNDILRVVTASCTLCGRVHIFKHSDLPTWETVEADLMRTQRAGI